MAAQTKVLLSSSRTLRWPPLASPIADRDALALPKGGRNRRALLPAERPAGMGCLPCPPIRRSGEALPEWRYDAADLPAHGAGLPPAPLRRIVPRATDTRQVDRVRILPVLQHRESAAAVYQALGRHVQEPRRSLIALGSVLLVIAAVLIGLGAVTWPPGGLLFALPFLFLMPGVVVAVLGGILLFIGVRGSELHATARRVRPNGRWSCQTRTGRMRLARCVACLIFDQRLQLNASSSGPNKRTGQ